jgi:O-antigen/teichoic acid export membrane protein
MAVALPFILIVLALRRAFYVRSQPLWAVVGGGGYMALTLTGLFFLSQFVKVSSFMAYLILGAAGLIVSVGLLIALRPNMRITGSSVRLVVREHWAYGRWSTPTMLLRWMIENIYILLLPLIGGLASSGILRSVMNLSTPFQQFVVAISTFSLPQFARTFEFVGFRELKHQVKRTLIILVGLSFFYAALLLVGNQWIVDLLYKGKYNEYINLKLLIFLCLGMVASTIMTVLATTLRAMQKLDIVFWAFIGSAAVTLFVGIPMMVFRGVFGAIFGMTLAPFASSLILFWGLKRLPPELD